MTGNDFRFIADTLGFKQADLAAEFCVDVDTLRKRFQEEKISKLWECAIVGLVACRQLPMLFDVATIQNTKAVPKAKRESFTFSDIIFALELTHTALAIELGVTRNTLRARCKEDHLHGLWRFVAIGLIMRRQLVSLTNAVDRLGITLN